MLKNFSLFVKITFLSILIFSRCYCLRFYSFLLFLFCLRFFSFSLLCFFIRFFTFGQVKGNARHGPSRRVGGGAEVINQGGDQGATHDAAGDEGGTGDSKGPTKVSEFVKLILRQKELMVGTRSQAPLPRTPTSANIIHKSLANECMKSSGSSTEVLFPSPSCTHVPKISRRSVARQCAQQRHL